MQPLSGIKILDFTRLLPGPLATNFLGEMGAEILKIESPTSQDYMRSFPPFIDNESAYFHALNTHKKCLSIDYTTDSGRAELLSLIATADVFIEQFRPDVLQKFQLDYVSLKKINPALIYISLTGYGQNNSLSKQAGHDLNFLATSGLLSLNKNSDGMPTVPSFQTADVAGGTYMLVAAVTMALFERSRTNVGSYYDIAMADSITPLAAMYLAQTQFNADKKIPFMIDGSLGCYNVYACADAKHIALAALEPKFWIAFCNKLGKNEWIDKGFSKEITAELTKLFATKERDEWVSFFTNVDCCISPVLEATELFAHPYFKERNAFSTIKINGKELFVLNSPIKKIE